MNHPRFDHNPSGDDARIGTDRFPGDRKVFAVGDVHGCGDKLDTLLGRLPLDPERDLLVFIGDYINRGPDSARVIHRLVEVRRKIRHSVFLMGNHEYELLSYAASGDPERLPALWSMGIEKTLASYGCDTTRGLLDLSFLPADHRGFLEDLRPWFRLGEYLFIHAGVIPGERPEDSLPDRLLTIRNPFLEDDGPPDSIVVFGHTPFETPFLTPNKIGIDTGACLGNLLTALELPRLRFHHA